MLPLINNVLNGTYFAMTHIVESIHRKIAKMSPANKSLFSEITF